MRTAHKITVNNGVIKPFLLAFFIFAFVLFGPSPVSAFLTKRPSPTPSPRSQKARTQRSIPSIKLPSITLPSISFTGLTAFGQKIGDTGREAADFLWPFEDLKKPKIKFIAEGRVKGVSDKQDKKAAVKGAHDSQQPSFFSRVFKSIGKSIAAVADFLWPFDNKPKDTAKTTTGKTKAQASPPPAGGPSPAPEESKEDTANAEVTTASGDSTVTVAVPNEIKNDSLTILGNLIWGDSHADRLTLKGLLASDILLDKSKTYTLGNSGERFKSGYFSDNVYIGDENRLGSDGMNVKGSMYLNTRSGGSIYLDADSGTVYLGEGTNKLANADSAALTIDPNGANRVQFHSSANFIDSDGNMTIAGTLSSTGGATSSDSVDITPATNIDALDITGTNITTASLIDLDPTGTTSGNIIDIDMSTAFSGAVISFDQTGAVATGDVIAYDNTGNTATTGDFIGFTTGTGDADGDVMDITVELGATSTQIFDVNNAAVSDEAGWLMEVDTTGAWTGNAIDFTTGAQAWTGNIFDINVGAAASTGDILNVSMGSSNLAGGAFVIADAGGARTDALIDITTASTGSAADAAAIFQINSTGVLNASANVLDINMSGGAASNVIDITTLTTAFTGNLVDLNFGNIADTGAGVDISMGAAAVDAQGLVISTSAGIRTSSAIQVTENNTSGTVATFNIDSSATRGGLFDIDTTGIWTDEHLIDITTGAQAWTANILDVNVGAAASTGDVFNVDMGSSNLAGGAFVIAAAGGARTDALIDITTASTGSAADAAAIFQINSTGDLDDLANVIDINMSGGTGANVIDITTLTSATSGNLIDLNFGDIADTGDAINVSAGASAVGAQALVANFTANSTVTTGLIDLDFNAGNAAVDGINLSLTVADGALAGTDFEGMVISITSNDVDADLFGLRIVNAATAAGVGADDTECLLCLDNAENTTAVISDAIRITNSGGAAGAITTAIDIDTTNVIDDFELQNAEIINNDTDDMVDFIGGGGTDNTDLRIDLDGTRPVISSPTDSIIEIAEDVEISGSNLFLALDNEAARDFALCVAADDGGATPGTTLQEVDDCDIAANPDYAEQYPTDGTAEFGDVMVLGSKQVVTDDGNAILQLVKSTSAYQRSLVGVISDNTGQFSSTGYNVPDSENPMMIALVGRVPVKVTNEGGPIYHGDYLTTSSTPGHAMKAAKAGPVAGMALGDFSGESGQVMAFIKAAWYDPVEEQKRVVLAALGLSSAGVLGATASSDSTAQTSPATPTTALVGPSADGSLGVLAEEVDLLVHGLLTAGNLRVTTAAVFEGTLVVKGSAVFEGDLVVKGAFSTGSLDLSGALTKTMTAGSDISAGDPVVVTGANTVSRAAGPQANVVGLAAHSAGAGSQVRVAVAGTVGGYSGLAAGSGYYVGEGGIVTTAPAGERAVHVGIAVSSSEMIVQIFESAAPPSLSGVVDTAAVDNGPTVTVDDNQGSGGNQESEENQASPVPSPGPAPLPSPSPEPQVAPSPEPEPSPTP